MEVYKKEPFRKTCLHVWNMREAVEAWLKYGKADWKPTTYRTYRQIAEKYIVPFLGNMKIDRITAIPGSFPASDQQWERQIFIQ